MTTLNANKVRPGSALVERSVRIVVVNTEHDGIYRMDISAHNIIAMTNGTYQYVHIGETCVSENGIIFYGSW